MLFFMPLAMSVLRVQRRIFIFAMFAAHTLYADACCLTPFDAVTPLMLPPRYFATYGIRSPRCVVTPLRRIDYYALPIRLPLDVITRHDADILPPLYAMLR